MALSRGGDQAVVKDSLDFQFYGGRSKSTEKRTKVKSRVMANALGELIADAGQVYVMGHEYADMDAVGAAAGICCAARKKGKKAQIVIDMEGNNARPLVRKLRDLPEYEDAFISGPDAFIQAGHGGEPAAAGPPTPSSTPSPGPCWWWWTPTVRTWWRTASCWTPATGWRSSTTTAGRPPILRTPP